MKLREFPALLKQFNEGLITNVDFLLKCQLTDEQVEWLLAVQQLPPKVASKLDLNDFDPDDPQIG